MKISEVNAGKKACINLLLLACEQENIIDR